MDGSDATVGNGGSPGRAALLLLRLWRLAAVALAAGLLHVSGQRGEPTGVGDGIGIERARRWFPEANRLVATGPGRGTYSVLNPGGTPLGMLIATSPESDDIVGYSGPNRVLVALDAGGRVTGMELVGSGDTPAHVAEVERAPGFWRSLSGWRPAAEPAPRVAAVAGSTLTSLGIAEAVERRLTGRAPSLRFPEGVTLDEVRGVFPRARGLRRGGPRPDWVTVLDEGGGVLGFAARSSPFAEGVRGHGGPTEVLALLEPDGRTVRAVQARRSYDDADYAERVREDAVFWRGLAGRTVEEWARLEFGRAGIEGVSGATETSYAAAEGLRRRLAADHAAWQRGTRGWGWNARDLGLLAIVLGAAIMSFTGMRGSARVRRGWQIGLVMVFGLWLGDLLSLALLAGWARHGVAWDTAPALVLMAGLALLVPWGTRRQFYCHQICPHGVVQEWLALCRRWRVIPSPKVAAWLERLPAVLLGVAFLPLVGGWSFNLARLEPFDAWTWAGWGTVSGVLAIAGWVAALFVPMAYCRFGCPTGALLRFVRPGGARDRFGARDVLASALLVAGGVLVLWRGGMVGRVGRGGTGSDAAASGEGMVAVGRAFGTTWSVKVPGWGASREALERAMGAELERVESTLSHWRTNSATSQFNASLTTLRMEMPDEFVRLVARCLEIARASDGAFDITVAPLVRAWGFGPGDAVPSPPSEEALGSLLPRVGWRKVTAEVAGGWVRKEHPAVQLDFGAILQGYAADRLADVLGSAGCTNFLIEVGGELLARGAWRVAIEDPERPGEVLRAVVLRDAALATSGTYRTRRSEGGRTRSHLIDPRTGRPVEHDTVLASVVHRSGADADAWATAVLVGGGTRGAGGVAEAAAGVLTVRGSGGNRVTTASARFPSETP